MKIQCVFLGMGLSCSVRVLLAMKDASIGWSLGICWFIITSFVVFTSTFIVISFISSVYFCRSF
jgi:hypothetical protein